MASKPKSVAVSNELFLLSCINHAAEGKIDFKTVGNECGMTTGAAAMRFRRFKEKHTAQLGANGGGGDGSGNDSPAKANGGATKAAKKQKGSAKNSPNKKRKLVEENDDEHGVKMEEEEPLEDIF